MKTGKSANNFSGNYVGLQAAAIIAVRSVTHFYNSKTGQTLPSDVLTIIPYDGPLISVMWGVQRRLGRRGFVDINAGPEITIPPKKGPEYYFGAPFYKNGKQPSLSLRVNAVIGLGW